MEKLNKLCEEKKPSTADNKKEPRKVSTPKGKTKLEMKEKNNINLSRTLTTKQNNDLAKSVSEKPNKKPNNKEEKEKAKKEKEEKLKEDKTKKDKEKKEKEEK